MDECMGWAASRAIKRMCYTGELTIRYLKRVPTDGDLVVCSEVKRSSRLLAHVEGRIVDAQGEVYARGEGRFLPLSVEDTLEVDDQLLYRGGEERVFDELRKPSDRGA
jgi:acyl-coenzyme A thioesterase PaaI-like protein